MRPLAAARVLVAARVRAVRDVAYSPYGQMPYLLVLGELYWVARGFMQDVPALPIERRRGARFGAAQPLMAARAFGAACYAALERRVALVAQALKAAQVAAVKHQPGAACRHDRRDVPFTQIHPGGLAHAEGGMMEAYQSKGWRRALCLPLRLYQAFRELGRVVRTVFLLQYLGDTQLREQIQATTNKVEAYNGFSKWINFGGGVWAENDGTESYQACCGQQPAFYRHPPTLATLRPFL